MGELNRAASRLKASRLPAYGVHDGAKIVVCSEELAEMIGASPAEIVGREVFSLITPEERDRSIASIAAGETGPYRSVGVRNDGTTIPVVIESMPVRLKDCGGEGRIVLVRDLSPVALVVDDEPPVARMTAMLMRYAGYQAVTCTSAQQVLSGYEAGSVSVIVTDVLMPEMDGVAMVKAIRDIDPLAPVVFVSGYTNIAVPRDERTVFVRKPFGMEDLRRALAELPERARAALE